MPPIWEMTQDCIDMRDGNVLHWPIEGGWRRNKQLLALMRFSWTAWRIFSSYAKGEEGDAQFVTRMKLLEGKPRLETALSDFELWEREQERKQTGE